MLNITVEQILLPTPPELVLFFSILVLFILNFIELLNIKKIGILLFLCSKISLFFAIEYDLYIIYVIVNILLLIMVILRNKKSQNLFLKIIFLCDFFLFYFILSTILFLRYLSI